MKKRKLMRLVLCTMVLPSILFLALGCDQPINGSKNANVFEQLQQKTLTKRIAASSYPLVAMAESIAGDEYEVWMPAKADKVPTADEIRRLQSSDVLLTNGPGAAYATWLPMVTLDRKRIFETTTNSFELSDYIQVNEHQIVHSHGGEGEHSHFWMVPHCWLNPRLTLLQAEEVLKRMCELYPQDASSFRQNYDRLLMGPLQEANKDVRECQELLKTNKTSVLLSDPRLKHLANAVQSNADCLLWFEPEEIQAARQQLQEMIDQKSGGQQADGQQLFLWARPPGPSERELMEDLKWAQLDLIESPLPGKGFVARVRDNFRLLKGSIEMLAEVDDGDE